MCAVVDTAVSAGSVVGVVVVVAGDLRSRIAIT